jgi:predicted  nucleic acid-binding Zn-ribbon protein
MTLIADLWALQEIDVALDARRASLEDAEGQLGETEDLLAARGRAEEAAGAARAARSAQRDLEQQADALRAKIGPLETKLYGGSVRNPKELADLQADIDQLKRQLSTIEDRDLEALTLLEECDAEARATRAEAESLEAAWAEEQLELRSKASRLREEIASEDARRRDQAERIAAGTLRDYDRLRAARGGRALAKLDRNLCLGCRISLPQNTVSRARGGGALVHCPNCERILVA